MPISTWGVASQQYNFCLEVWFHGSTGHTAIKPSSGQSSKPSASTEPLAQYTMRTIHASMNADYMRESFLFFQGVVIGGAAYMRNNTYICSFRIHQIHSTLKLKPKQISNSIIFDWIFENIEHSHNPTNDNQSYQGKALRIQHQICKYGYECTEHLNLTSKRGHMYTNKRWRHLFLQTLVSGLLHNHFHFVWNY